MRVNVTNLLIKNVVYDQRKYKLLGSLSILKMFCLLNARLDIGFRMIPKTIFEQGNFELGKENLEYRNCEIV